MHEHGEDERKHTTAPSIRLTAPSMDLTAPGMDLTAPSIRGSLADQQQVYKCTQTSRQTGRQLRLDQSHDRANRTSFLAVCAKRNCAIRIETTSGGGLSLDNAHQVWTQSMRIRSGSNVHSLHSVDTPLAFTRIVNTYSHLYTSIVRVM